MSSINKAGCIPHEQAAKDYEEFRKNQPKQYQILEAQNGYVITNMTLGNHKAIVATTFSQLCDILHGALEIGTKETT